LNHISGHISFAWLEWVSWWINMFRV